MKKVLVMLVCGVMFLLTSCGGPKSDAKKLFNMYVEYDECVESGNDDCDEIDEKIYDFEEKIRENYTEEDLVIFGKELERLDNEYQKKLEEEFEKELEEFEKELEEELKEELGF